jgi:hypothetical protein
VVEPALTDQGWRFGEYSNADRDTVNRATYLHEVYTRADLAISDRATVPVLCKKRGAIVNNESVDILRMMNSGFSDFADPTFDLYPADPRTDIDALNARVYPRLNNGVYRAGFATTQLAYEEAFHDVFEMLDEIEDPLADGVSWRVLKPARTSRRSRYAMKDDTTITPLHQPGSIIDPLTAWQGSSRPRARCCSSSLTTFSTSPRSSLSASSWYRPHRLDSRERRAIGRRRHHPDQGVHAVSYTTPGDMLWSAREAAAGFR